MRNILLSLGLSLSMAGCGAGAYLKTVDHFAETAETAISALQPASGFRGELCRLAARYDYVGRRAIDQVRDPKTGKAMLYVQFEQEYLRDNKQTWAASCEAAHRSDALVDKALAALSAYASALGKVVEDDFPGENIADLSKDASELAKTLASNSPASKIAASLANPIASAAKAVGNHYKRKQIAAVLSNTHDAVTKILEGVDGYLEAVHKEAQLTHNSLSSALRASDASNTNDRPAVVTLIEAVRKYLDALPAGSPAAREAVTEAMIEASKVIRPADVMPQVLHEIHLRDEIESLERALRAARDAVKKLAAAEVKLVAADGNNEATELADALGSLALMIEDIHAVRNAIQGKADN